jgi:uncharacterized membrane protein YgdD (TMEM256/DUF423 family)
MARIFVLLGGISGFLAVAFGAFGAHALRARISADMLEVYKTGVNYHMAHALALILVGILAARTPDNALLRGSGWLFVAGIVLFSGSLYVLAISGVRGFGAVTPLGGLCFLAGWVLFIMAAAARG